MQGLCIRFQLHLLDKSSKKNEILFDSKSNQNKIKKDEQNDLMKDKNNEKIIKKYKNNEK